MITHPNPSLKREGLFALFLGRSNQPLQRRQASLRSGEGCISNRYRRGADAPGMTFRKELRGRRGAMISRVNFVHGVSAPTCVARIGGGTGYAPTDTGTPPCSFAIEAWCGQQPTNHAQIFSLFSVFVLDFLATYGYNITIEKPRC